jgi:hypothetical protein
MTDDWQAVGEPPSPPQVVPLACIEQKLGAVLGYFGIKVS